MFHFLFSSVAAVPHNALYLAPIGLRQPAPSMQGLAQKQFTIWSVIL